VASVVIGSVIIRSIVGSSIGRVFVAGARAYARA
jgi:hypothetical protein